MTARRGVAVALAMALVLAACSDDDQGGDPTTTTSSPTRSSTTVAPDGLVQVEVEGRPSAIIATAGFGLLIASDGEVDVPGRVRGYASDTGGAGAEITVGPAPIALVAHHSGTWVIGATGVLTKVDPASPGEVEATVEVGGALVDAAVVADRLWVADLERSVLHVLDPENGEVVSDPVPVPAGVVRVVADGARLWVSGTEDQVTPIDTEAMVARQPVRVGNAPIGMAVVQDVLWVANSEDDTVTRLSLESGQLVGTPLAVGDAPVALAVDGSDVWVLNQDDASVLRLDAETGEPIGAPVDLPMRPRGMAVSTFGLWVVGVDPSLAVLVPNDVAAIHG